MTQVRGQLRPEVPTQELTESETALRLRSAASASIAPRRGAAAAPLEIGLKTQRLATVTVTSHADLSIARACARRIALACGLAARQQVRLVTLVAQAAGAAIDSAGGGQIEFALAAPVENHPRSICVQMLFSGPAALALPDEVGAAPSFEESLHLADRFEIRSPAGDDDSAVDVCFWMDLPEGQSPDVQVLAQNIEDDQRSEAAAGGALASGELRLQTRELASTLLALQQRERALEQGARRNDEFLAMLAHELRNPLAAIHFAEQLLRRKAGRSPERRHIGDVIARQTTQLMRLVDDLVDASRMMRGQLVLEREPLDVAMVVAEAIEGVADALAAHQHVVDTSGVAAGLIIDGDRVRVRQLLGNLLHNAAKFTPQDGRITVAAQASAPGLVEIVIRDTGTGIDALLLPRVFDLFVQARPRLPRSQTGLGVGLTVVSRLVAAHGGEVFIASAGTGLGTTVTLRLPQPADPVV